MSEHSSVSVTEIGPDDLQPCMLINGRVVHLMVRDPRTGRWSSSTACGNGGWTQAELDAQLAFPPRLDGVSARCGAQWCAPLWEVYDRRR